MSSLVVRPSADSDLEAITRIYGHYVLNSSATFELEPPGAEEMARRRKSITALGMPYLVGEYNGRVVGYAYASSYRPRPGYRFTVEDSIYLDPDCVGRGYGSVLLRGLMDACAAGQWRQMIAVIGDSSNVASFRLHERFGFRHVGTLQSVGFKFDRWVDTVLMQKELESVLT